MLRTAFIALLAPMTAGTAACGEPPPKLAFRGHVRTRLNEPGAFERRIDIAPDFRVTVETTRSYGRVQFTGSLTNPGRDRLAAATSQVELAWDPP